MEKKQDPIVFIHSISSYFNYLGSVKDVLKWSHHGHITIFSDTWCRASEIFFANKQLQIFFKENTLFQR